MCTQLYCRYALSILMRTVRTVKNKYLYHIFTVKYVLFTYAIQAQVLCTYRDTISRKLYQFKICQNPYLPREIWTHITPPYHTPDFFFILSFFHLKLCWESCISSKFVKIHISLGRYGLISHPHITPQNFFFILSFFFFLLEIMLGNILCIELYQTLFFFNKNI